jgi:acyl-lipid omega-6 desaturase (Delta-12 desaturase)
MDSTKGWTAQLSHYKGADDRRAIVELIVTLVPFMLLWVVAQQLLAVSLPLAVLAAAAAALFVVRLFMIQHDCGHGAMFTSRAANDWVGRVIGVLTLTPYDYWREAHAQHHAGSGNLDRRGIGDIDTLTVDEYLQRNLAGRFKYRLYRHPLVLFGLGPIYLFLFQHRLPPGTFDRKLRPWTGIMGTNVAIAALGILLALAFGYQTLLLVQLPIIVLASALGVWLFYVQHQFEHTYWEHEAAWSHGEGALRGSSFYDLPRPLMWLTGYIGIHHVHHLASRIPYHRLPRVIAEHPELKKIGRLTIRQSLACVRLTLWDEERKLLIPFAELARRQRSAVPSAPKT